MPFRMMGFLDADVITRTNLFAKVLQLIQKNLRDPECSGPGKLLWEVVWGLGFRVSDTGRKKERKNRRQHSHNTGSSCMLCCGTRLCSCCEVTQLMLKNLN